MFIRYGLLFLYKLVKGYKIYVDNVFFVYEVICCLKIDSIECDLFSIRSC